ncbi:phosphotransferase family protein [Craterilacuibacter sp.]|uniref:phosphotransferase family protein n=1 Tax=Craterilacuibacter sp. TaxID=2870909 RepID=UPI003F2DE585
MQPPQAQDIAPALAAWLARHHGGSARILELRPPAQGYSNETWLIDAEFGAEPQRQQLVLRLAPAGSGLFPDYDLALQYRVMAALADSPVPVPGLYGFEEDASVLGRPFYLMRRIEGRVPNENPQYHIQGWLGELDAGSLRRHWFAGIETAAQIARIDWRAHGLDTLAPGGDPVAVQLDELAAFLTWTEAQARPYPLIRRALAWLAAHRPASRRAALVWGDAKLGNLIFDDAGRVAAALDWESAHIGDVLEDLAWFLVLDRSLSEGYAVPRLAHLPSREESIACWEAASSESAALLPWFELFAAARLAVIMARLGTLFTARGWVAPEVNMDTHNGGYAVLALTMTEMGVTEQTVC